MSDCSDHEEFFDAEETTPTRLKISEKRERISSSPELSSSETLKSSTQPNRLPDVKLSESEFKVPHPPPEPARPPNTEPRVLPQPSKQQSEALTDGRKWFRELRQQMLTDEEDLATNPSPPDSQTSSVDGMFAIGPSKTSHPFRIIEHDGASVHSMTSLGRVGRLLSGTSESGASASTANISALATEREQSPVMSSISVPLQEPDVIASTKTSSISNEIAPVAPPRKKKKKCEQNLASAPAPTVIPLPSPASTIESLTRELENSLDIQVVTKGQYVVKPQDEEKSKAEGPPLTKPSVSLLAESVCGPRSSNSIGRTSINSAIGLSMSHFTGTGSSFGSNESSNSSNNDVRKLRRSPRGSHERRRSFGDDPASQQLNMFVRTRTDSGKQLSDMEILEQVTVLNLDTGERVPLSVAEDKLPQGINPLSLHIMRLTSEYVSNPSLQDKESDEESVDSKMSEVVVGGKTLNVGAAAVRGKRHAQKLKKFLGTTVRKTVDKAKSIAQEVSHGRHKDEGGVVDLVDDVTQGGETYKLKVSNSHKGPYDFDALHQVQDLSGVHQGPVWCMKFSACGRLLATAGQDRVLRVWVLRSAFQHFQDMRTKYNAEMTSPKPSSQESLVSQHSLPLAEEPLSSASANTVTGPFMPRPFCTYSGHTSDLLDLSWSKNYFILSSSMDKTVRLWHISRKECLCCFQHIDFVTAIVFHPRDDRYFLSGSLDGKLRLWNIPDKKVAVWNEVDGQAKLITAANFCQNGKFAVVGIYDGRCIFYNTEQLKYHTTIHVRSSRGRNATGRKISGIEPMPGEDKILITSNDSRIRLYDLRDLSLTCKYKGYVNVSSQIKAGFSHDGKYILSGSENQCLYIWKTHHDFFKFSSARRDRNDFWEGVKAHNAVVTCAVFAPQPRLLLEEERLLLSNSETHQTSATMTDGYALVSADFNGCIKVFVNKMKLKHSSLPASALA